MDRRTEEFRKRLLATFCLEAAEHIRALSSGLMELEKPSSAEAHPGVLETIFREAHSLKGAARTVGAAAMEAICQSLEDVFSDWQRKEMVPSPALFELLHRSTDSLEKLLLSLDGGPQAGQGASDAPLSVSLVQSLEEVRQGRLPAPVSGEQQVNRRAAIVAPLRPQATDSQPVLAAKLSLTDTVRVPAARLDALLLEAEEFLTAKLGAEQRRSEVQELRAALTPWKKVRSRLRSHLRANGEPETNGRNGADRRLAQSRKLLELQDQDDHFFHSLDARLSSLEKAAERDYRSLERMVEQLLDSAKKVVMLPASSLLENFPKLVRDLARDQGKAVELELRGAELEMDRRILEQMKEPLLHLVRNCIDHGIETAAERELAGKPLPGSIHIDLSRKDSDKALLSVSDDGAGIRVEEVRSVALKLGILSAQEASKMEERQTRDLIFHSGISTSPIITDISGRGLGLAIVKEKVEKLGGVLTLETRAGRGTIFRMVLPLTRAAFRGVVVRVNQHLFVLPTVQVERVLRLRRREIKTVENRETVLVDGRTTSLVHLRDVLGLPVAGPPALSGQDENEIVQVVLLGSAEREIGKCIAFLVDEVVDEQEVLAKPLGKQLAHMPNVSGATVLGTGRVVPILEGPDLLKSAVETRASSRRAEVPSTEPEKPKKSILVAEDSITTRALLRNILEGVGYEVQVAVDGAEAFAALKTSTFDLIVSDVDMPRMSGFALTAKIRSDPKLAELPVVLVTALGSREDRERGIDAGANAYIVKSSFDQSNLLEVLRRLL
jgi:two-component system chemotaxis sensor kinase CheA